MKWPFVGGAVLAMAMVAIALYVDQSPLRPRPDRLSDVVTVVEQFERVVFRRDNRDVSSWEGLGKWTRPTYFVVYSANQERHEKLAANYASSLSRLTGLIIENLKTPDGSETLPIHFIECAERSGIAKNIILTIYEVRRFY